MTQSTVHMELHYLPSLEYMALLAGADTLSVPAYDRFGKRSYRNRAVILGANNSITLSIPVHGANKGLPAREMRIDNQQSWQRNHWRSICSAYGKTPYFEYYAPDLERYYQQEYTLLSELTESLLRTCLDLCELDLTICHTNEGELDRLTGLNDRHNQLKPSKPWQERDIYRPARYVQPFGDNFVPNLSVLDLLFNEGPNSRSVLIKSRQTKEKEAV